MTFQTDITRADDGSFSGPFRAPAQMLADQEYGGHSSVHDDEQAAKLGLAGAPIEGPTHFSQFDALAVEHWGSAWFERGCISSHFLNMVVEGEEVAATLTPTSEHAASIHATKRDGTPVLAGTATLGTDADGHGRTELDERRTRGLGDPGELYIVDRLEIGMTDESTIVTMDFDSHNGALYPFTLEQKLERITESSTWYEAEEGRSSPWNAPIVPTEMLSVLAHQSGGSFPVRGPAVGLFIDLEVRFVDGPVFVGRPYRVERTLVGIGQSRSVESYWTESIITDVESGIHAATVLLHQGVFKASFADYPS